MPYVGERLAPLFGSRPTARAARDMAASGGDAFHDLVVRNTPIDSGNLRTSWYRMPTRRSRTALGEASYVTEVRTDVEYAPYVEHGTGLWGPKHAKYEIKPKLPGGTLAFRPRTGGFDAVGSPETGGLVFRKAVMHPGSPGAHMVANAAARLEATMERPMVGDLHRWAAEQEALGG